MPLVNISEAARLVGVSRQTFYRHIEKKGISTSKDEKSDPVVDTAELLRVYGALHDTSTGATSQKLQTETPKKANSDTLLQLENQMLRERLADKDGVIDDLRRRLDDEAEERRKLTKLLTDQRTEPERPIPAPQKPTESFRTRLGRWIAGRP